MSRSWYSSFIVVVSNCTCKEFLHIRVPNLEFLVVAIGSPKVGMRTVFGSHRQAYVYYLNNSNSYNYFIFKNFFGF